VAVKAIFFLAVTAVIARGCAGFPLALPYLLVCPSCGADGGRHLLFLCRQVAPAFFSSYVPVSRRASTSCMLLHDGR